MLEKIKGGFERYSKYFSKVPKKVFLAVLIIICVATTVITLRKTVTITVDGKTQNLVTYKSKIGDLLKDINITLAEGDKAIPSLESKITKGGTIEVKRAVSLSFIADGKTLQVKSAEDSIKNLLESEDMQGLLKTENISALREMDKITPSLDEKLSENLKVEITRIDTKVETTVQPINFSEVTEKDNNKTLEYKAVTQKGEIGQKEVSTMISFENGKQVASKIVSEKILKNPITQILVVGTKGIFSPSRGINVTYSKHIAMQSTAYSKYENNMSSRTATGVNVKRDPSGYSTIAVDPRVIPLGTKLYINGYGYAIAADVGSAIKGNRIDVYFDSLQSCLSWGSRGVDVYIID